MQDRTHETYTGNSDTGDFKATPGIEILMLVQSDAEMTPTDAAPLTELRRRPELWTVRETGVARCCIVNWPRWECQRHFFSQNYNTARIYYFLFCLCIYVEVGTISKQSHSYLQTKSLPLTITAMEKTAAQYIVLPILFPKFRCTEL
jgi:hypothetical protein